MATKMEAHKLQEQIHKLGESGLISEDQSGWKLAEKHQTPEPSWPQAGTMAQMGHGSI